MDRCVKGKRKTIDEVAQTQAGAGNSKAKYRKYDEAYLALGFTHSVYTRHYSYRVAPQQSTLDVTKRPLQIVLTLCQYITYRTSINLMSGICHVASHRAAPTVDSITDYNGFYCILSWCNAMLASGVDRVFNVVGEEERPVCVLCLSGQHETH